MANISYDNFFICVKKLMIFIVTGNENISLGPHGFR